MSFVLPMLFSLLFDTNDNITINKIILILLAILSVFLVIYPNKINIVKKNTIIYPILLFIGIGVLDSLVKYCQFQYITTPEISSIFSAINFSIAGIIGIIILITTKTYSTFFSLKTWTIGITLGVANFGSMYFLINALNSLKHNNSLIFGINNIGIVTLTVSIAIYFFKERLSITNRIGLVLSLIVLIIMINIFI
jgi:multidrug transporter EmrE-like cation transporter